jgi:transaldolase
MYVEALVVPHTVNTMPLATIDAYQDHGTPFPQPFGAGEIEAAKKELEALAEFGIDMEHVVAVLEDEGVDKFAKSWELLTEDVDSERQKLTA